MTRTGPTRSAIAPNTGCAAPQVNVLDLTAALTAGGAEFAVFDEITPDAPIPLIEKGVMNGAQKTLHQAKLVAGFVLGTRRLFDFIDDNPANAVAESVASRAMNPPSTNAPGIR